MLAVGGLAPPVVLGLCAAPAVLAHGGVVPTVPPDPGNLLLGWSGDPLVWLPAIVALILWRTGVRRVNRAHPGNPVPPARTWAWVAGVLAVLFALDSGIERYDTTLFWVHMVQHMLLTLVAPILLLYAGPITLLLRASSAETRRRWIFPFLHSRVVRFLSFPVVSWLLFAVVMWASHFSPLFDAALEDEWIHRLEHALFLGSALLFWWPVVGPDPSPWRMKPAAKVLYVGLQMPQNTFLALAIYMSTIPLYQHYVTTGRTWGPTPLEDQQMAGGHHVARGRPRVPRDGDPAGMGLDARRGAPHRGRGPAAGGRGGGDPGAGHAAGRTQGHRGGSRRRECRAGGVTGVSPAVPAPPAGPA